MGNDSFYFTYTGLSRRLVCVRVSSQGDDRMKRCRVCKAYLDFRLNYVCGMTFFFRNDSHIIVSLDFLIDRQTR
jgi:hypothetical protein